jgi:hypothetical protein
MRKYLLILTLLGGVISGCKLDESGFQISDSNQPSITGMWFIKVQTSFTPSLPQFGTHTETSFTAKDYYVFGTDKTVTFSSSNPSTVITGNYTYNALAKNLSFGPDIEENFTVTKLTTDSLALAGKASATVNNVTTFTNITIKLSRK